MPSHKQPITLEVCCDSLSSAVTAAGLGVPRIELNSAFTLGGLTPSIGLVSACVEALRPTGCAVIVMVRPRPGGFSYGKEDLAVMRREIDALLRIGVAGVALGVLKPDGTIDDQANRALIGPVLEAGRAAVFHRAFDWTPDPIAALDALIELGFTRVLTSGQAATAHQGSTLIRRLIEHARGRIEVLPGSGITPGNVAELIKSTGCTQVHASLGYVVHDPTGLLNPAVRFSPPGIDEGAYHQADADKIIAMMEALSHTLNG